MCACIDMCRTYHYVSFLRGQHSRSNPNSCLRTRHIIALWWGKYEAFVVPVVKLCEKETPVSDKLEAMVSNEVTELNFQLQSP